MPVHVFENVSRFAALPLSLLALACAMGACSGDTGGSTRSCGTTTITSPPPPPPQCVGVAEPCSQRDSSSCDQNGCYMLGTCDGIATSCYDIYDSFRCQGQQGCQWSGSTCSGVEASCDTFKGSFGCGQQSGCLWMPGCIGDASSCDQLSNAAECATQPGCSWQ
jgi:hypothetical protein